MFLVNISLRDILIINYRGSVLLQLMLLSTSNFMEIRKIYGFLGGDPFPAGRRNVESGTITIDGKSSRYRIEKD